MSSLIVEVCEISDVSKHPNADRLDIVTVKGWQCVTGNGEYRKGDKCIYIPIDSELDPEAEAKLFSPDSKIKLSNHRIKTIKIRGAISQGMVVRPEVFGLGRVAVGSNVAELIGVKKYEPPQKLGAKSNRNPVSLKQVNPNFHKYTDIENYKNFPNVFEAGEIVTVTEKIHGTNFRCGWVKTSPNTWWKKLKKFFGVLPEWEFVYGSRNVQLQDRLNPTTYYDQNVYGKIVKQYDLRKKLLNGEVIYGEIYGDGIQKNYSYGCKAGEHKAAFFDLMRYDCYVSTAEFQAYIKHSSLPSVPILFTGPYDVEYIKNLSKGNSVLCPAQKIREGVVVKPLNESTCYMGRKVLKLINDDYLLKAETTELH